MPYLLPPAGPRRNETWLRAAEFAAGLPFVGRPVGFFLRRAGDDRFRRRAIATLAAGLPLLIGVIFIAVSLGTRSSAALSGFVQAHGVRRQAVIVSVQNFEHQSSTSSGSGKHHTNETSISWTALVQVSLAAAVDGQSRTTVHVPNYENAGPGDELTVLVDPDNPGYAELPGAPSTSPLLPAVFLIVGSVLAAAGIGLAVFFAWKGTRSLDESGSGFWGVSWHRSFRGH